jgi:hypothetical protein
LQKYIREKEVAAQKVTEQQQKLSNITQQYGRLKILFDRKDQSQTQVPHKRPSPIINLVSATGDETKPKMHLNLFMVGKKVHYLVHGILFRQMPQKL